MSAVLWLSQPWNITDQQWEAVTAVTNTFWTSMLTNLSRQGDVLAAVDAACMAVQDRADGLDMPAAMPAIGAAR